MQHAHYNGNMLCLEDVPLANIAESWQTPCYVYSANTILQNLQRYQQAFGSAAHCICYALKANSNPAVLKLLADAGAGGDVVSAGELLLALDAGMAPGKIVFAGVGKRDDEIRLALSKQIRALNVESLMELQVIAEIAAAEGVVAPVSLRVNPDIDIHGHPYIATGRYGDKFGIPISEVPEIAQWLMQQPALRLAGIHAHIGSQIKSIIPYEKLGDALHKLIASLREMGHRPEFVDAGGGLGIEYEHVLEAVPNARGRDALALDPADVAKALLTHLGQLDIPVFYEPGRSLVANSGLLLTRVLFEKHSAGKPIIIVDAGMTELIRPSLYQAYHAIVPVQIDDNQPKITADIVGPICESGDFLARERMLQKVGRGDLLAVMSAGAYGYTLSSNYNARPRIAELLVDTDRVTEIRAREQISSIWQS